MGPLTDIKVFSTKSNNLNFLDKICFYLKLYKMIGIMMKLFYEVSQVHFSLFSTLSLLKPKLKVSFCVLWEFMSSVSLKDHILIK